MYIHCFRSSKFNNIFVSTHSQFGCLKLYSIIAHAFFFITMNWWLLCVGVWKCHNFLYHISLCASEERRRRGKMSNSFYFVNFVIQSNLLKLSWIWVECALSRSFCAHKFCKFPGSDDTFDTLEYQFQWSE